MFDVLLASTVSRRLGPGRVGLALGVHAVIIFGAVRATAAGAVVQRTQHTPLVVFESAPVVTRQPVVSAPSSEAIVAAPRADFLAAPSEMPATIPPVVPGEHLDLAAIRRGMGSETPGSWLSADSSTGSLMDAAAVDEPAAVIRQPSPRYPPVLQQAGIEGRVLLEFVIDSAGHPEAGSLRVIERSAPGFDAAAYETIEHSLFRPARFRGRPVRQRTLQAIVFRVGR